MSEDIVNLDHMPDHEAHHVKDGERRITARQPGEGHGRLGTVFACAVPGISLTNYAVGPSGKGWGPHCAGSHTTITLSNGVRGTCRSEIAELSTLLLNETIRRGYDVRQADTGCYNCRLIAGTSVWSNHAWGLAWDINWQSNPMRRPLTTDEPVWMQQLWNRYGFAWGGDYVGGSTPDAMHHEFMGTPDQAAAATDLARAELTGVGPVPVPAPAVNEQFKRDQMNLNDSGFPCGTPDGIWGPVSIQQAKNFQQAAGLVPDGVFGPASRAAIAKVPSWRGPFVGDGGYPASRWQQKLKDHGWRIDVDNVWGAHSQSILSQYQNEKGLIRRDGVRDSQAWVSLYCTVN
jgi:hypothetical protein